MDQSRFRFRGAGVAGAAELQKAPAPANSWVLHTQITADSDWLTAGSEGDVENEERTAKINVHLQSLLVPSFKFYLEILIKSFRILLFSAT